MRTKKHPTMDVALVPILAGLDSEGLEGLATIYARWARQIRALISDMQAHKEWEADKSLSASERRYCELEGISASEFIKRKGGDAR